MLNKILALVVLLALSSTGMASEYLHLNTSVVKTGLFSANTIDNYRFQMELLNVDNDTFGYAIVMTRALEPDVYTRVHGETKKSDSAPHSFWKDYLAEQKLGYFVSETKDGSTYLISKESHTWDETRYILYSNDSFDTGDPTQYFIVMYNRAPSKVVVMVVRADKIDFILDQLEPTHYVEAGGK